MKGLEYKSYGSGMFLVYCVEEGDSINPMGIFGVATNHLQGFAPTKYSEEEGTIEYDVTAKQTLNEFLSNAVAGRELLCVLNSILDSLIVARDNKVDLRSVLLDEDYVFVDPVTAKVELICLPVESRTQVMDINGFLKGIITNLKYDHNENGDYVVKLITFLNENQFFIYEDFKALIKEISGRNGIEEEYFNPYYREAEEEFIIEIEDTQDDEVCEEPAVQPTGMFDTPERKTLTADDILGNN